MIEKTYKAAIAFFVLVVTTFCIVGAQDSDRAYRVETFKTSGSPSVTISTSGGSVNVIGRNTGEVRVEMYVSRGGRYLDPSDTDLSGYDVNISSNREGVIAEAKRLRSGWNLFGNSDRNLSISFVVYAPENSSVSGRTSGGSVSAENIASTLSLKTSGGSVSVENVSGEVDLHTSGGSINIDNAAGTISGRTSGGSVSASNVSGAADLRTSGGSIQLENISARISARTSGGSIRGEFLTFEEDIDLQTSGGNININLPGVSHFNLDLKGQRVNTKLRNFTGEFKRDHVEGRIGNGGPLLTARTSGGSVNLRY